MNSTANAFGLPSPMGPPKQLDQFLAVFGSPIIEILVDRFVADMQARMLQSQPPGDDLRRSAQSQLLTDIITNRLITEPRPTTGLLPARIVANLGPAGRVQTI